MENISSVKIDVTKQAEIDATVDFVKAQKRGLYGIINNASVAIFSKMSETKGRTAIISSISGYVTGASSGAYSMSKSAVEAYSESLADDLKNNSISVAQIDPGGYKSKIRKKIALFSMTGLHDSSQKLTDEQKANLNLNIWWCQIKIRLLSPLKPQWDVLLSSMQINPMSIIVMN